MEKIGFRNFSMLGETKDILDGWFLVSLLGMALQQLI